MSIELWMVGLLAFGSLFFTVVGVVGLYRLPDIYTRAHAVTKADTLGAGFALVAVAVAIGSTSAVLKAALLFAIVFVANPTAVHLLVRAAYSRDVSVWTTTDHQQGEQP